MVGSISILDWSSATEWWVFKTLLLTVKFGTIIKKASKHNYMSDVFDASKGVYKEVFSSYFSLFLLFPYTILETED